VFGSASTFSPTRLWAMVMKKSSSSLVRVDSSVHWSTAMLRNTVLKTGWANSGTSSGIARRSSRRPFGSLWDQMS
jgi:hypothetical protein